MQIFLVLVGVVCRLRTVRRAPQTTPSFTSNIIIIMNIHTLNRQCRCHAAQMGVAKPDYLRCVGADQILIENADRFARIDLDLSDFEKERIQ